MVGYGYGYGTYTSQPQPYAAASYAPASFAYAGAPQATPAYAFAQPQVPMPVASAGYGYFQPASDPNAANYLTSHKTSQGYGYATGTQVQSSSYTGTTYQKPVSYAASAAGTSQMTSSKAKPSTSSHQNAYEKVVYNAANSFLKQQGKSYSSSSPSKPTWPKKDKSSMPPKVQQIHYCEVCKISCAGLKTYNEHLEGGKHKKKAAMATSDTSKLPPGTYKCELCEIVCTGKDAYNAHVKGSSHQKTLNLHQKLGKPIPEVKEFEVTDDAPGDGEVIGESYVEEVKSDAGKVIAYNCTLCECQFKDKVAKTAHVKGRRHRLCYKKKVDPKVKVDMRGDRSRRERNELEAKADEKEWRQRQHEQMRWEQQLRFREEELRRCEQDGFMRKSSDDRYWTKPDRSSRDSELEYYERERRENYIAESQGGMGGMSRQIPHYQFPDDRLVMTKHKEIYPKESDLKQIQTIVAAVEKSLKMVSDTLEEAKKKDAELKKESEGSSKDSEPAAVKPGSTRILKGVMRVGALAKGLLLKGQSTVELVVLCTNEATYTLLKKIGTLVPEKLKEAAPDEKFNMSISVQECAILIHSTKEPKCTVKVALTSPAMRDDIDEDDKKTTEEKGKEKAKVKVVSSADGLDKEKALLALASLRHAKWFQARANSLTSCVVIIRVLRDFCNRTPAFKPLSQWAIELLCEKSLASSFQSLGPGDAFRRVMEAIASGIFLPHGSGLLDPCEKEKTDAASNLSDQEREDITAAAQNALRLQAFRQLHKVLEIEEIKGSPNRLKRSADRRGFFESRNKIAKKE